MARTIAQIKAEMLAAKAADTNLNGLTSTSQTAIWRLWIYIVAASINILEQLMDIFKTEVEQIVVLSAPSTPQWTKDKVERFQYDAAIPQVAELNTTTFVVEYPTVNTNYQIITRCSVTTAPNRTVNIKVAKNDPPEKLAAGEITALEQYIGTWNPAGIDWVVISEDPDRLAIRANVYYNGQYSAVIQTNVETALKNYMANLPFNGVITTQGVVDAIQLAEGVTGLSLTYIYVRRSTISYGNGTTLYDLNTSTDAVQANTYAGYVIEEDTAGQTFADKIFYIVAS